MGIRFLSRQGNAQDGKGRVGSGGLFFVLWLAHHRSVRLVEEENAERRRRTVEQHIEERQTARRPAEAEQEACNWTQAPINPAVFQARVQRTPLRLGCTMRENGQREFSIYGVWADAKFMAVEFLAVGFNTTRVWLIKKGPDGKWVSIHSLILRVQEGLKDILELAEFVDSEITGLA